MSRVLQIQKSQDITNIVSSYRVVIIDSYADWCYPCKMMEPKYEELAARYSSKDVCFAKCNAELDIIKVKGLPSIDVYVNGAFYTNILGADIKRLEEVLKMLMPSLGGAAAVQQPPANKPVNYKNKNDGGYKSYGKYWS